MSKIATLTCGIIKKRIKKIEQKKIRITDRYNKHIWLLNDLLKENRRILRVGQKLIKEMKK